MPYTIASKRGLASVTLRDVGSSLQPITLPQIIQLDIIWHLRSLYSVGDKLTPNWGGFMQTVCTGPNSSPAVIHMLPLIDLKSSDDTCMYSTLLFVTDQARKLHMPDTCITFDQPLWLKAVEISKAAGLNVVCRLGGFHLLMSFIGSVGAIMADSGLQELLGIVYGAGTVDSILSGKAVARAVRGHLLAQAALTNVLLKHVKSKIVREGSDDEKFTVSVDDEHAVQTLCQTVVDSTVDYNESSILQSTAVNHFERALQQLKDKLCSESRTARL